MAPSTKKLREIRNLIWSSLRAQLIAKTYAVELSDRTRHLVQARGEGEMTDPAIEALIVDLANNVAQALA